jgi:hypothetical protein
VVDTDLVKEIEQGPLDHDPRARIRSSPRFSVSHRKTVNLAGGGSGVDGVGAPLFP